MRGMRWWAANCRRGGGGLTCTNAAISSFTASAAAAAAGSTSPSSSSPSPLLLLLRLLLLLLLLAAGGGWSPPPAAAASSGLKTRRMPRLTLVPSKMDTQNGLRVSDASSCSWPSIHRGRASMRCSRASASATTTYDRCIVERPSGRVTLGVDGVQSECFACAPARQPDDDELIVEGRVQAWSRARLTSL